MMGRPKKKKRPITADWSMTETPAETMKRLGIVLTPLVWPIEPKKD